MERKRNTYSPPACARRHERWQHSHWLGLLVAIILSVNCLSAMASMDPWGSISIQPTLANPWSDIEYRFYNATSPHSFYLHDNGDGIHRGPAIFVDGDYVCSPDAELAWPGSGSGNQSGIEDQRGCNGWWKNTYNNSVNGKSYTIKFWDPGRSNNTYGAHIIVYIWALELDKPHTVLVQGWWKTNGQGTWLKKNYFTLNAIASPFNAPTGIKMTDPTHFKMSGNLNASYGPTWVGTKASMSGTSYLSSGQLDECKQYNQGTSSYSNVTYSVNRSEYYKTVTMPVEYILKRTLSDRGDFYLYKWFNVVIPGFPRATNVKLEPKKWNKTIIVNWGSEIYDQNHVDTDGKWYIYRKNLNDNTVELVGTDINYNTRTFTDDSETLDYSIPYKYYVSFVPNGWTPDSWTDVEGLYASSDIVLKREYRFNSFTAEGQPDRIVVDWNLESFSNAGNNNTYDVVLQRSVNNNTDWKTVYTQTINHTSPVTYTYNDDDVSNPCTEYFYRLKVAAQDTTFYSDEVSEHISGVSKVTSIAASRGTYTGRVRVQWEAEQYGTSDTYYTVRRRLLGSSEDKWVTLYTTNGTAVSYNYQDDTAQPGDYYEYQVISETKCEDANGSDVKNSVSTDGFCQARGVVSGRISYGTGTAVEGAQVVLTRSSESGSNPQSFYSLRLQGAGEGVAWPMPNELTSYTVQFFLRPELDEQRPANAVLLEASGAATPLLQLSSYDEANKAYQLVLNGHNTGVYLKASEFTLITLRYNGTDYTLSTFDQHRHTATHSEAGQKLSAESLHFGYTTDTSKPQFQGYLDEIRIFSRALTDDEITHDADRTLAGNEDGLVAYIPLDEGIQALRKAYDYSKTGGAANENHGDLTGGTFSTMIPESNQLGLLGYSDSNGNYVVRGVPFNGEGTNYSVTPMMNSHEFTPERQSRYISAQSLVHSGVDFTDISSFEVKGIIRYAGTNIPVEGVQISVDGRAASRNNEIVETDDEGKFIVDVPIGKHYLGASKDGHTFVDEGRIPADPSGLNKATYEFIKNEEGWQFWDNTLVPVAGRVVGGAIEGEKPLGFADDETYRSKNTIGQAEITLEIPDKRYMLNAYEDTEGLVSQGFMPVTENTPLTYPADVIATGSGYRTGGTLDSQAQKVVITTDAETGDFAVLLPPLDYKVTSVKMVNADADRVYKFDPEQLPRIDASDPATVLQDSIPAEDGGFRYFEYVAAMKLIKHTTPMLSVRQKMGRNLLPEGVFGDEKAKYEYKDGQNNRQEKTVTLYTVDNNVVNYTFGYPIFGTSGKYTFALKGYENYHNYDASFTGERDTEVPLKDVTVTVSNEMSAEQKVYSASEQAGENQGKVVDMKDNQLQLDENGEADYIWVAGLPNPLGDFTRVMNMTYNNGDGDRLWSGTSGNGLKAIVFGDLPNGNNFTTKGPDKLDMILHDPYGDSSFATWEKGAVTTKTQETVKTGSSESTLSTNIHLGPKFELEEGLFISVQTEIQVIADLSVGYTMSEQHDTIDTKTTTVEYSQAISTSADPDMIGADADIYIGQSQNLLFGGARSVGIKGNGETEQVVVEDAITVSEEFDTHFYYTQYDIINKVIPNLIKLRNNELEQNTVAAGTTTNNHDTPVYITSLDPQDEDYGKPGTYTYLKGKKSCQDMVNYYNESIKNWEMRIAENEKFKLDCINKPEQYRKKNTSFGGGIEITESESLSTTNSQTFSNSYSYICDFGTDMGFTINEVGLDIAYESHGTPDYPYEGMKNGSDSQGEETTTTATFSYTLADSGVDDMFSVDIYHARDNHSPVFRTKGGQSSCPYEAADSTVYLSKYYSKYKKEMELSAATVQIEKPVIRCENRLLTGVPTGGKAQFELELWNDSGIGADAYFDLVSVDGDNPKGARLSLPTGAIGNGHTILVPAASPNDPDSKPVKVILTLEQINTSVTDYEDIKLALVSTCQSDEASIHGAIKSEVSLSAHFVPASTPVTLALSRTEVNINNVDDDLTLRVSGFDRSFTGLKRVDIQYKRPGEPTWTLLKSYIPDNKVREDASQLLLPENGVIELAQSMKSSSWTDGTYLFRAQSSAIFEGSPVTAESEVLTLVKDVKRPQLFGMASPTDGILNAGDEISLTFNEDIQKELLTDNNFVVSGVLNGAEIAHDVALSAQNTERAAYTEASINLAKKDFSADMWVNVNSAGDIFTHGNGDEKFKVSIDDNDHLVVTIGNESYTSTKTIEKNNWTFLAFNYGFKSAETGSSLLNARAVTANTTEDLFTNQAVADYAGTGSIVLGQQFTGAIHELTLWDNARSVIDAQAEMYWTKKPSTPHLIGYWKMDEGNGKEIRDYARNRHLTLTNSTAWYLNNDNKAVTLDGTDALKLNISECSILDTEDYAVEMWFKGDKTQNTSASSLLYTNEESVGIGFNNSGRLTLTANGQDIELSSNDYLDNAWHHLALNVLRNGNATVYVDGQTVKTVSAQTVPPLEGAYLYIGTRRNSQPFTGSVDEIRLWKAAMTGTMLNSQRTQRLVGDESGLVAYYPFETMTRNTAGIISSVGTANDLTGSGHQAEQTAGALNYTDEAPAMKVKPVATNVAYSYVANERGIVITLNENAERLEGTTVNFTVRGVKDMNGNESDAINWTAYIRQNSLLWKGETEVSVEKTVGETATFEATIINESGLSENWSLSGLPVWLTASATSGTLKATMQKTITFTVDESAAPGKYEQTIYLTGNNNIAEPLTLYLKVRSQEPDWAMNVGDYEETMNVIGSLQILGLQSQDEDDIVAAFIGGECRGVARPEYKSRYDGYFVTMDIYGNGSENSQPIELKVFDASSGIIYPVVKTYKYGETAASAFTFEANTLQGRYTTPMTFAATDEIEQNIELSKGWNWMSLSVRPGEPTEAVTPSVVFAKAGGKVLTVKGQAGTASYDQGSWISTLAAMTNTDMYAVNTSEAFTLNVTGHRVNPAATPVTVKNGWNWVGYCGQLVVSVADALADMEPQDGDIIKGQKGVAYFDTNEWSGSLRTLMPGKGYKIQSVASADRTFTYPTTTVATSRTQSKVTTPLSLEARFFTPVDYTAYPANMVLIARVVKDGLPVNGAELGVFADSECREAAVTDGQGMVYITVPGDAATKLTLRVVADNQLLYASESVRYETDAIVGTPRTPLVIDLAAATSVESVAMTSQQTEQVYDLQGRKVKAGDSSHALRKGVYIVNGRKQVK